MAYLALYRKWRPLVFEDVVEQEHVVKTLRNSINTGRIAHAYLFSGTRGTGKTTMAKIFSRAVNCLNPKDGDPCNECEICKGILNGSLLDVIEIDAASNNGVDNVRELRDEVVYTPSKAKYKVYIIDEVHMLSTGAFNALLKTLEEPPSHVIFILATTEPHKLPATILSRCQRFDFRRISVDSIAKRIEYIAGESGVDIKEDASRLIAKLSDGALRDAISILDQCISLGNKELTYEDVLKVVGLVTDTFIVEVVDNIKNQDVGKVLEAVNRLV
ncbi:MAG TPA: DNA polymerase III subunit gamma/tau, partial [Acetivibrio sp.]|nr:DNA polymerase III subunit gamma/tau [Acetivibrio sp.]